MALHLVRDTFCSFCGTKYAEPLTYPRACGNCATTVWANPIPVAVVLVPVRDVDRVGLLVVRRAIPPGTGLLALVGGFVEDTESWQQGGAREVREETGVVVPAAGLEPLWYASTEPKPNRVLLFSVAPVMERAALPPFAADGEASARGLIFGPGGLEEVFAFSLHTAAAKRYFEGHHVTGPHDFVAR